MQKTKCKKTPEVPDPYEQCKICGKWHYTHADEKHTFVSKGPYKPGPRYP